MIDHRNDDIRNVGAIMIWKFIQQFLGLILENLQVFDTFWLSELVSM